MAISVVWNAYLFRQNDRIVQWFQGGSADEVFETIWQWNGWDVLAVNETIQEQVAVVYMYVCCLSNTMSVSNPFGLYL